ATAAAVQERGAALEEQAGVVALELELVAAAARDDAHLLHRDDVVRRGDVPRTSAAGEEREGREGAERAGPSSAGHAPADTRRSRTFRSTATGAREREKEGR